MRTAIEIEKKTLGENDPACAYSLGNLATVYYDIGDYVRAEPLMLKSTEIFRKASGENDPEYAASVRNLAVFYSQLGDYAHAEPLCHGVRD